MQPFPILQATIPPEQITAATARLPQMQPVAPGQWLRVDDAYAAQLAEKARLLAERRNDILRCLPGAEGAAEELLETVLADLAERAGFTVRADRVQRPDGLLVGIDRADPLATISRLVQEDMCIHQKAGDEHHLTAALLAFPSAWTLAEKIGHPLSRIHRPVDRYDADVAARVQRMFDMVRADRPLWRANLLRYDDPALFQPHAEANPRKVGGPDATFVRSEYQTIRRLPRTDAVVFTIHVTVIARDRAAV